MKNYSSVYKAYDLRSVFDEPMDTTFTYSLGKAMGGHFVKEYGADQTFLIGCDVRLPNPELVVAFICGLEDAGCASWTTCNTAVEGLNGQEQPLGVCSTAFFYRCMFKTYHLGAVFTASHNPPEWVGMKNANSSASLLPSQELADMVESYEPYPYGEDEQREGTIVERIQELLLSPDKKITQKWKSYVAMVSEVFDSITKPCKIVVDYSGGACVGYEYAFFQLLSENSTIEVVHLNEKADGLFTAHLSDTNQPSSYEQVGAKVRETNADFGVMFDGDGDRVGMVDEHGVFVSGDSLVPVIASALLESNPGKAVVYDVTCSNSAPDIIKKFGGVPHASKVGYRNVKELMKETDAIYGGELSGHMLFPETGYAESTLLALGYVMKAAQGYDSFSELIAENTLWIKQPVTNYHVEDKVGVMQAIKEAYSEYPQNELDGIRIDGPDRWFLVRASNTEPKLRTYIEAKTQEQVDILRGEIEGYL